MLSSSQASSGRSAFSDPIDVSVWPIWLLAVGIIVLFAGAPLPLTDGDSALYGKIAKNVLASGDWVVFHYRTGWVVDKPPLTLWLISLSFAAFGTSEWALRVWHLVLALATVISTYALARLALPRRKAILSAFILLTSSQFFYQSLVPQQDIPLTLFVTQAVYWHLRWEREERPWAAILSWISVALAVLSKGIVGLAFPVLIVGLHLLIDRPPFSRRHLLVTTVGVFSFLLIASPWFIAGTLRQGRAFIDTFFLSGTLGVGRFFHPVLPFPAGISRWSGVLAYVVLLPLGILPWTGWLWPALKEGWNARRSGSSVLWLCTLWILVVMGFLTVSLGDKVIRYLLPVFPPFAVLAGHAIGKVQWTKSAAWVSLVSGISLAAVLIWTQLGSLPGEAARYLPLVYWFLPAFIVGLGSYPVAVLRGRPRAGITLLATLTLVSYGLLVTSTARNWDRISPWRQFAKVINSLSAHEARVLIAAPHTSFADYYVAKPVAFVSRDDLIRVWQAAPAVAVVPADTIGELPTPPRPMIVAKGAGGLTVVSNFPLPNEVRK